MLFRCNRSGLRALLVCVPPVALALAGCGGSSSSSQTANFGTSFSSTANQLKATSHEIGVAIERAPSRTDAQLASTFSALAARWQNQVNRLKALQPPSSVSTAFNRLKSSATRVEADLNAIAAAAETHNASAAKQATASLVTDILSAKSASTTITNTVGAK